MAKRKPHTLVRVNQEEAPQLNANLDLLYRIKPESIAFRDVSANYTIQAYQEFIHGEISVSANGTTSIATSIPLDKRYNRFIYVNASICQTELLAHVTDKTASSITISVAQKLGNTGACGGFI